MKRIQWIWAAVIALSATAQAQDRPRPRPDGPRPERRDRNRGRPDMPTAAPQPAAAESKDPNAAPEPKKPDHWLVLQGGTVHTVSGADFPNATVVCRNGKIDAIGRNPVIPEGAEVIDCRGRHVYPGIVAVESQGVLEGNPPQDAVDVFNWIQDLGLTAGLTTIVSGNNAVKLTKGSVDDVVLKSDVFANLTWSNARPADKQKLRAALDKIVAYQRALEAYNREKEKNPDAKAPDDAAIKGPNEANYKLLKGETKASVRAQSVAELLALCELSERYGIKLVIRGAREGWTIPERLAAANVELVLSVREQQPEDEDLNRKSGSSIENAAILSEHGLRYAVVPSRLGFFSGPVITTAGLAGRDLLHIAMEAAFAVRGGADPKVALRSITLDAAKILGVDHRVGSLEVGKDADFAVTDGDLLHYMTLVQYTIVNGRVVYDKTKETLLDHIRAEDGKNKPVKDYWPRRLGADF